MLVCWGGVRKDSTPTPEAPRPRIKAATRKLGPAFTFYVGKEPRSRDPPLTLPHLPYRDCPLTGGGVCRVNGQQRGQPCKSALNLEAPFSPPSTKLQITINQFLLEEPLLALILQGLTLHCTAPCPLVLFQFCATRRQFRDWLLAGRFSAVAPFPPSMFHPPPVSVSSLQSE